MAAIHPKAPQVVLGIAIVAALAAAAWTALTIQRPSADSINQTTGAATLLVTPTQAQPGDAITVTLTNTTGSDITLPTAAPYVVLSDTTAVFSPISAQALTTLPAGESRSWTWNQQSDAGSRVTEGAYTIVVTYVAGSTPVNASAIVGIHTADQPVAR